MSNLPALAEDKDPRDSAFDKLAQFLSSSGCQVLYEPETQALTAKMGKLVLDCRVMENRNIAHVTSSKNYRPDKAGTEESRATVLRGRDFLKSKSLLRITVAGTQSIATFVELWKGLPDPERSICQAVMFILQTALDRDSGLHKELTATEHLKDVPQDWLPAGAPEKFPELADFTPQQSRPQLRSSTQSEE